MIFNYFEIHLTEHCNLNCKCCDNFSSIADEVFLDENSFENDMARMSYLGKNQISMIRLLGGEPLLHKNIEFFLTNARKNFPNTEIRLTTNGIKLSSMPASFWVTCKNENIIIEITYYPINIHYEKFMPIAESMGISVIPFNNEKTSVKYTHRNPVNDTKNQDINRNYRICYQVGRCMSLKAGKVYPCTCIPNICHFNKFFGKNLKVTKDDYIDIYKVESISEIEQFLENPVPFCGYCNVSQRTNGHTWGVTKKEISEWFDE